MWTNLVTGAMSAKMVFTSMCVMFLCLSILCTTLLKVSYMILARVSPVTHSVGNCVKRVVVIVTSVLFFRTPVSPINSLGKSAISSWSLFLTHWFLPLKLTRFVWLPSGRHCHRTCRSFPVLTTEETEAQAQGCVTEACSCHLIVAVFPRWIVVARVWKFIVHLV